MAEIEPATPAQKLGFVESFLSDMRVALTKEERSHLDPSDPNSPLVVWMSDECAVDVAARCEVCERYLSELIDMMTKCEDLADQFKTQAAIRAMQIRMNGKG